jgi:hypothetical protein
VGSKRDDALEEMLEGRLLSEAIVAPFQLPIIQPIEQLRANVEANAKRYMLSSVFSKLALDVDGKVIAKQGPVTSSDATEREAALLVEMVTQAATHYDVMAVAFILPARAVLMRERPIRIEHMMEIAACHPLVDRERERLVAEGIYAGLTGDMAKAIHLIVPQLEHSVRALLERSGVRVSTFDQYGFQEERNLNRLLREPKLAELLGEDVVFALRALLIEKGGPICAIAQHMACSTMGTSILGRRSRRGGSSCGPSPRR